MIRINDEVCNDIADFFKIFGDAGRIKINSWTNDRKYIMIDLFGSFQFPK